MVTNGSFTPVIIIWTEKDFITSNKQKVFITQSLQITRFLKTSF